jgi:serine/threonine-protein kinase
MGPYRLLNVVHTGHACQLWQAYDDGAQRVVGVKVVTGKYVKDSEQIAYLRQEYAVGRKVVHPRIIQLYSFARDRGTPYLAMEWFPAPNLKVRIRQGVEKIAYMATQMIQQAAEGLGYFNSLGWIHRDVKPDNFLVSDDGQVKLIDFGLAIRARQGLARLFSLKSAKRQGTPSYMSPEQIRCEKLDERTDVYSFGCVVFELLAGRPPYTGTNLNELLNKHLKASVPALENHHNPLTAEITQLVRRCLAKDPATRPSSLVEFLEEFRNYRVFTSPPRPPDPVAG